MPKLKYINAVNYLLRVTQEWPAFCKAHPNFATAVKEILAEDKQLTFENELLLTKLSHSKMKKKKKTSERQIELQVLYRVRNHNSTPALKSFFTEDNLVDCIYDAIDYAKRNNYTIHKMWVC